MASENVLEVTDGNFDEEVVKSSLPVLVDFWAVWCQPCRAIAPHVEALAEEFKGQARVAKCDLDANPKVPTEFGIRSIPTLLMFKDGQVVGQIVGAQPKAKIEELLKKAL